MTPGVQTKDHSFRAKLYSLNLYDGEKHKYGINHTLKNIEGCPRYNLTYLPLALSKILLDLSTDRLVDVLIQSSIPCNPDKQRHTLQV